MYISNIQAENFRGIMNLNLDLQEGINLLIGNNGAGKTTLLHAIGIAATQPVIFLTGISSMKIQDDARMTTETAGDAVVQNIFHYPIRIQGTIVYDGQNYICDQIKMSAADTGSSTHFELSYKFKELANRVDVDFPMLCFVQAGREHAINPGKNNISLAEKAPQRTDGYKDAFGPSLNLERIQQWCLQMDFAEYQRKHKIEEYETFKDIIHRFFSILDPQMKNDKVYYSSLMGSIVRFDGETEKSIYQLSDGYQAVFCLILELAYRAVMLNPSKSEVAQTISGIVMIDEIEMHLHPAWQWTILKALRETFPCIQFIISTHSPIVLSSAKDAALYLMQDPNNIKKMDTGYGFQVNDVLMNLQGSRYQPDRVSDYYNQIEAILESGTDEDLNHLLEKAKDEFADAPHVLKEIKDFVEVNRWVEEA